MKVASAARIHQRKLHFPGLIGFPDGPIAALRVAAQRFRNSENGSSNDENESDHSVQIQVHGASLLLLFPLTLTECPRSSVKSACPASGSGTRVCGLSR